jgi:hypothetical protein
MPNPFGVNPDNSQKQSPIYTSGTTRFSHAITPDAQTIQKRPSYVIVNNAGNYSFAYESGSYPENYLTGSVLDANGPIRLDINPVAWGGTSVSKGDITFVYVRVM